MLIKVLGPGCAKCKEAENIVKAAVQDAGSSAAVEKVTDLKEMMALGVMSTPAVVIDNKIMCTGRVPSKSEVMGWIATPGTPTSANSASAGCCCCGGKC
jgi:small redox-active disulfide protein 2